MKVIKRDGQEAPFAPEKIRKALDSANGRTKEMTEEDLDRIVSIAVNKINRNPGDSISVEAIQDLVEDTLLKSKFNKTAKSYILYRDQRTRVRQSKMAMMKEISEMVSGKSDYWNNENSNKNAKVVTTQRDYMAGIVSTEIAKNVLLPQDVVKAHNEGIIHFHDMDYYAQNALTNCCLINLRDMLQNGTMVNGVKIDKPHKLLTATTIATQIIAAVASSQYGGTTITLTHLAPFARASYEAYLKEADEFFADSEADRKEAYAKKKLKQEIEAAVQTFNYQVNSMSTTNGQAPFISVNMYLGEDPEYTEEVAMLIEEFLKQRILGMKNRKGVYITPAFPKLLYVLEEQNVREGSKYRYLTELAAKCTAKRMVPDYISEKIMKELKGSCYPCMGCRSFLTPDRFSDKLGNVAHALDYREGEPKFYGRLA